MIFFILLSTKLPKCVTNCLNTFREDDIVELVKAAKERNLSLDNSDFIWLLALLSSQVACNAYLYNLVPLIVDHLYKSTAIGIGVVAEACKFQRY